MHHIYHTEALILGSRPSGEANRVFVLLTKELGMIFATAQGVRLQKSKLRYTLQDYSYANIDLVRGKDVWRVTSATPIDSFHLLRLQPDGMRLIVKLAQLLRRLIRGEVDTQEALFNDIVTTLTYLNQTGYDPRLYETAELCLVLRILKHLGYLNSRPEIDNYVGDSFALSTIDYASFQKKTIIFEINRALRESHL